MLRTKAVYACTSGGGKCSTSVLVIAVYRVHTPSKLLISEYQLKTRKRLPHFSTENKMKMPSCASRGLYSDLTGIAKRTHIHRVLTPLSSNYTLEFSHLHVAPIGHAQQQSMLSQ